MIIPPNHIFRGYDLRGVSGKDLSPDIMEILGKAYATFLYRRQINEAVVGRDNRLTSEDYSKAFVKGLRSLGINVVDIGLSLAQILYFAQYRFLSKGGGYISASHNPKEYNGLKLAVGFSDTMITEEIQELREIAQGSRFNGHRRTGSYRQEDVFPSYKADLKKRLPLDCGLKVVIDGSYATPSMFLPDILREAGCEVFEQNTELDGSFPLGTPDPTEHAVLERLAKRVLEDKADLGLTYDADGDRIGFVDHTGRMIWNDVIVALFARDILHHLPGAPIVFNTLCSKAVSDVIAADGGKPVMWITGHSFIKEKVKTVRAPFGGELSGHFFFMDNFYGHDDGAFSTLRLLSFLIRTGQSLKDAVDKLPKYISSPEIKVGCPDAIKFDFVTKKIGGEIKKLYPNAEYVEIDGVRMDTKDTMAIVRASQNGPYITVKFEGRTKEQYEFLRQQLKTMLKSFKELDWSQGVNADIFD